MANDYTNRFGQGMMPVFDINPGATTPLDVGADAAATEAAYLDAIAERNATNKSNIAAFNTGIESLKDLMSDEDQEEEALQDMITSAVVPELNYRVLSDEDTGKFESGQTFTEDLTQSAADFLDLNPKGREILGNVIEAPGEGVDFFVDEFESGYNPEQRNSALAVTGEAYRAAEPYIKDALKGTGNFFIDQYNKIKNTPIEKYEYETDFYQDLLGDKTREEEINSIPIYATGGRVGLEEGGGLFERTSQIPEMFTTDELPSDPLSQIVKIGMAVRAPLLDVVEMLGLGAKESARIVSDLVKQGYDVTEPIRDVAGDAIADTAEFIQEDARDMGRFMSPAYYADRFIVPALRGEEARTDTETRLRKELSDRGRSSATQERTEMLKQKLFEETFGKDTQGRSALARPVEIDLGDDIRVNYNTGGLAYEYSPFMNMQQGIDYYGQFADSVPRYGQFSPITSPGERVDDGVKSDPTNPIFTDMGTLEGPRGGPEDRGSYADRFGTAEDQGYGYSGIPGEGGSGTFNNPAFGEYGDTFTPGPGIGQAYDEYGRLRDIGVLNDIGLNAYDAMYGASQQIPGFLGATAALVGSFFDRTEEKKQKEIDEFNQITANQVLQRQKKEQEEREAAAAQKAAEEAAAEEAAQTLKETYAANQYSGGTGSGDNKPSPGTGTFSGGVMSGFTGGGQSPHSSMSSSNSPTGVGGQTPGPRGERGGAGGKGPQGRSRCFVKGTMVEMADGTTKEITTITPGMETRGGTVEFVLQGLPVDIWDYKGVKVSGTHWVVEDNQLIAVEDSKHGIKTDMFEPVYSMKTSKQRMWVKGIEFGDFESGTDEDWEPYFEKVRQDLNKKLHEKRKENQQSDERV